MGFTKWIQQWFGNLEARVMLVGLDAAGKTTFLYRLKLGEVIQTTPTIGFSVETISYKKLDIICSDIGGQDKIRPLWRHYYHSTDAVVFMVDSQDRKRLTMEDNDKVSAEYELKVLLAADELRDACFLIMANKQESKEAMKVNEIVSKLGLLKERTHNWYAQGCSCLTGDGLYEGLDWLVAAIKKKQSKS